ncbi:C4-dicarboxylate transport sensor protein dctB [Candidatus Terasakiella magnetica]|nr:C4-dicarboxylate transport sensor protein dctB [Candidatus Terasakiella magnetica]
MNRIAAFVVGNTRLAWAGMVLIMVMVAGLAVEAVREVRNGERLSRLETEADRRGIEIMSQTLNGNLMGALSLLGLIDGEIKRDALGQTAPNAPKLLGMLEDIGHSHAADGIFIIGQDGVIKTSWNSGAKPSTGLDVKFRPYFQMAARGKENVYAAVSLARGDRALYFSTPIFAKTVKGSEVIGAVVARTGLSTVDAVLKNTSDIALLLSPQGVVFASSRAEWIGNLNGAPAPERLAAIREIKQFGTMFENREPTLLPVAVNDGIRTFEGRSHAVAEANVQWNDPFGQWTLVLMENLDRTVPAGERMAAGAAAGAVILVIGLLVLNLLRSHHTQTEATRRLAAYAKAQEAEAGRKARLAEAALRFQRSRSPHELAQIFLAEAHQILGALQGVVYVFDGPASMALLSSYACGDDVASRLAPGEGLLGQCVVERRGQILDTSDDSLWTIRSGLGSARPGAVLMAPLILHDTTLGVAEIAVLTPADAQTARQFEDMVALLAMNIEILRRNQHGDSMVEARECAQS